MRMCKLVSIPCRTASHFASLRQSSLPATAVLLQCSALNRVVTDRVQARRYFVAGTVQGVGFRWFVADAAERLGIEGYARNLRDGRVEVYAMGRTEMLAELKAALHRGPRFASVASVEEEPAETDARYTGGFRIE